MTTRHMTSPALTLSRRSLLTGLTMAGGGLFAFGAGSLATGSRVLAASAARTVKIGSVEISVLSDGVFTLPVSFILPATPADVAAKLIGQAPEFRAETNVVVISTGGERILVDTGAGGDFMPTLGKLADTLEAAGIAPASITRVVFTHAHADHFWGVIDPFDGGSRFTKARHVMSVGERDYWLKPGVEATVPAAMKSMAVGTVRRLKELGDRIETAKAGAEIAPGIALVETPGHTPGHVSVMIRSGTEQALIGGDALTHPMVSFAEPGWHWGSDAEPDVAVTTRKRLLDQLATEKTLLLAYHLSWPGIGRVEKIGTSYRFVAA